MALTIIPTHSHKVSLGNQIHDMAITRPRARSLYNHPTHIGDIQLSKNWKILESKQSKNLNDNLTCATYIYH